jgi:hypothetical protein
MRYINSNADIIVMICWLKKWKCLSNLGVVVDSPIDRIDRKTRKYYLFDGTVGDIPEEINLQ